MPGTDSEYGATTCLRTRAVLTQSMVVPACVGFLLAALLRTAKESTALGSEVREEAMLAVISVFEAARGT